MAVICTYNNNRSKLSQMRLKKGELSGTGKLRIDIQTRLIITRLFGKFTQLPEEWVPNKRALH